MKYYIAYGSNTPQEMEIRCPGSKYLGVVDLADYQLSFNYYATVKRVEGSSIKAMLYKISTSDEKKLDLYEGVPGLYRKETCKVVFDGKEVEALIYIMNHENNFYGLPESAYLATVGLGYKKVGIPMEQLLEGISRTARTFLEGTVWHK